MSEPVASPGAAGWRGRGHRLSSPRRNEGCAAIRVGPAGVALVTWDWTSDARSEQYTSLDRATLRRALPRWLDAVDQSEKYADWRAKQTELP